MNGVHDMGGMHGFGPVEVEQNEPVFHWDWERTVYAAISGPMRRGIFNLDAFRRGIESMEPAHYLRASYYERWLETIISNLEEQHVLAPGELEGRIVDLTANPNLVVVTGRPPAAHPAMLPGFRRPALTPARFAPGDAILARNRHTAGHTRLPRYIRAKRGAVHAYRGCMVFPDSNAHGRGEAPEHVYSVRFEAAELWGESGGRREAVYIDLWESYLLPAEER